MEPVQIYHVYIYTYENKYMLKTEIIKHSAYVCIRIKTYLHIKFIQSVLHLDQPHTQESAPSSFTIASSHRGTSTCQTDTIYA